MTIEEPGPAAAGSPDPALTSALEALKEEANTFLEGAREDVNNYLEQIAAGMVHATATGNDALRKTLIGQMEAIGELNRVRAQQGGWRLVGSWIMTAARAAVGAVARIPTL